MSMREKSTATTASIADELGRFIRLVREMREAQRNYFLVRDKGRLKAAKALERKVDDAIDRHCGVHQETLF
jgi:hypothetical protein